MFDFKRFFIASRNFSSAKRLGAKRGYAGKRTIILNNSTRMTVFNVPAGKHEEDWLHAEDSLKEGIHFYVKVCHILYRLLI